jgi:hypothetical protein
VKFWQSGQASLFLSRMRADGHRAYLLAKRAVVVKIFTAVEGGWGL